MPTDKKLMLNEKENAIVEKMRLRLQQSYNIECLKSKNKDKK